LGDQCVDRQMVLELIWKTKAAWVCVDGAFWAGYICHEWQ